MSRRPAGSGGRSSRASRPRWGAGRAASGSSSSAATCGPKTPTRSEAAAAQQVPIDRDTLERLGQLHDVLWTPEARATFVRLLAAGRAAVAVFEALEHVDVLERLLPEWEHVRALPQRNAYHRFTVDRHLLEAVAECAALLDRDDPAGKGFDGDVARRARADVLLLGALLHDIAKGHRTDHSELGAEV